MRAPAVLLVTAVVVIDLGCTTSHPNVRFFSNENTPAIPAGVTGSAGPGTVQLSWQPNPTDELVSGYWTYSATEPWSVWSPTLAGASATRTGCCTAVLSGLANDEEYWIAVAASNQQTVSAPSFPIAFTPPGWRGTFQSGDSISVVTVTSATVDPTGDSFVAGSVVAATDGQPYAGAQDAVVAKLDASGRHVWTRDLGTASADSASAVAADTQGNVYIAGSTAGAMPGHSSGGGTDGFLAKYDRDGTLVWIQQFGTSGTDSALALAVFGTSAVFVAGSTSGSFPTFSNAGSSDLFTIKLSSAGNVLWTRQIGTIAEDDGFAASTDSAGALYVAGTTFGNFGGHTALGGGDIFIMQYMSDGSPGFSGLYGTTQYDLAAGISCGPSGSVFVTGEANASWSGQTYGGSTDAFLLSADTSSGSQNWVRLIGSAAGDRGKRVVVAADGSVLVDGMTIDTLSGQDPFVSRYDSLGNQEWLHVQAEPGSEDVEGLGVLPSGYFLMAGQSNGPVDGGPSAGGYFVKRFRPDGSEQ